MHGCWVLKVQFYSIVYTLFYRQFDFSFEPWFAKEILENEPKSCLTVA